MSSVKYLSCEINVPQKPDGHSYGLQNFNKQLLSVMYIRKEPSTRKSSLYDQEPGFSIRMSSLSQIGICGNINTLQTKSETSNQSFLLQRLTTGLLTTKILKFNVTDPALRLKINLTDYNDAKVINQTNVGI